MSKLIVEVCEIDEIMNHSNADSLSIAIVKGWQVIFNKEQVSYSPGDKVIYVPPDTMVPMEQAVKWGVDKYLHFNDEKTLGKTKQVRLRGEMSFGFLVKLMEDLEVGTDVAEQYNLTKWEPSIKVSGREEDVPHALFYKYTDIENIRNFPRVFQVGEEVVVTEKIHGTNSRIGICMEDDIPTIMAGSRTTRKKIGLDSLYEYPLKNESVKTILEEMQRERQANSVILYGEIYGKVQDLRYGLNNDLAYRAFDLSIDGEYINYLEFKMLCDRYNISMVPILYQGPFDIDILKGISNGKTTIMENPGKKDIREGIVIKPVNERIDSRLGRVILKLISDDYLIRKNGTEDH